MEPKKPAADKLIITTSRSHMTQAVKSAIDACNPTEILRVGGAGHKVGFLLWLVSVIFISLVDDSSFQQFYHLVVSSLVRHLHLHFKTGTVDI